MNIVYCTDSVCFPGGIQRATIAKANALAEVRGNRVWIVVTDNQRPHPVLPISESVHLVDLGIKYYEDDWKSKWNVLDGLFFKRRKHKRALRKFLNSIVPDILISTGTSEKYFLPHLSIKSSPICIREIHFSKDYRQRAAKGWFDKLLAAVGDFADYRLNIWCYDRVVLLTEEDKSTHWRPSDKLLVIPNPTPTKSISPSSLKNKTAIAVGRLVNQKNFESLIRAWAIVYQDHRDWRLEIWGDGALRKCLEELIYRLNLEAAVSLKGYTDDIQSKYTSASFLVCSSLFEGLPLMMIEAMSAGLPIVSYACPCGPKDLVREGKNGYLVPTGDENALANRICHLIEDECLRIKMGASSLDYSKEYRIETIVTRWMDLFLSTLEEKRGL